ncbi:MAG: ComF family protein [Xanthomonadales bacterium]|nr:ComF family protein [Xanthomonadales bacterium]
MLGAVGRWLALEYSAAPDPCQPESGVEVDKNRSSPCRFCGQSGFGRLGLCGPCLQDLPLIETACAGCGLPTPQTVASCGACLQRKPAFDGARALATYAYPFDWLIRRLKFAGDLSMEPGLARRVWAFRPAGWPAADVLVPIPLHRGRLRERGYDQGVELARALARVSGLPVRSRLLVRQRSTAPQTGLSAAGRRRNLSGAFRVGRKSKIPGRVCLIDDVMTTGATVDAAASTLRDAGVREVLVWAAGRATT